MPTSKYCTHIDNDPETSGWALHWRNMKKSNKLE